MSRLVTPALRALIALAQPIKDRPVVYRGRNFQIVGYGVFAMLASISIMLSTAFYLTLKGQPLGQDFIIMIPLMGFMVWLGSKTMHLVALGKKFWTNPVKYLTETGFYVQGGIFGAMIASLLVANLIEISLVVLADGLAWSAMLGLVFGRLGCFNYGCCYGREAGSEACSVCYHNPEVKALRLQPELQGKAIHPTQLYTAALNGLAFVSVALLIPLPLPNGLIGGLFLLYHGAVRIGIERLRGDIFFDRQRNWTTFRAAGLMAGLGVLWMILGTLWLADFGEVVPLAQPFSPWTLVGLLIETPSLALSIAILAALVLLGFGVHGRKLGNFPGAPQNREVPILGGSR